MCVCQVMRGSAASCWSTTVSLSPAKMEPLASAAWRGPDATVPKVGAPTSAYWNQSVCGCVSASLWVKLPQQHGSCASVWITQAFLLSSVLCLTVREGEEHEVGWKWGWNECKSCSGLIPVIVHCLLRVSQLHSICATKINSNLPPLF